MADLHVPVNLYHRRQLSKSTSTPAIPSPLGLGNDDRRIPSGDSSPLNSISRQHSFRPAGAEHKSPIVYDRRRGEVYGSHPETNSFLLPARSGHNRKCTDPFTEYAEGWDPLHPRSPNNVPSPRHFKLRSPQPTITATTPSSRCRYVRLLSMSWGFSWNVCFIMPNQDAVYSYKARLDT